MKRAFLAPFLVFIFAQTLVQAQASFFLIDNFEPGRADKWYSFGKAQMTVTLNPTVEGNDSIAESWGEYALAVKGQATNWYVGGIGTDLALDASQFSRLQVDIKGSRHGGKLKIELFDDDNGNTALEQDSQHDWQATKDDKWVAELPILGEGITRVSIPFTAFRLENPGAGNGIWDPGYLEGSGGLLKIQLILLGTTPEGEVAATIDNILLTY